MILRTEKNQNYTTLCNIALNDPELSLKAKGLFAFLMSKPADWKISYRGLMTQLREGQRAILGALAELEQAGYLQRDLTQNEQGQIYFTSVLREQPMRTKRTHGAAAVKPVRTKPTHGKRTRAKRTPIVNTDELNTDKEKLNKKVKAPSANASDTRRASTTAVDPYSPETTKQVRERIRQQLRSRLTGTQSTVSPSSLTRSADIVQSGLALPVSEG